MRCKCVDEDESLAPWRECGRKLAPFRPGEPEGCAMRALPEFTAEASIYRSAHQYRSVAASSFRAAAVPVELAQEFSLPGSRGAPPIRIPRRAARRGHALPNGPTPPPPPSPVDCGTHFCAPRWSCCANGCCASGTFCCASKGCCSNGHECTSILGVPFCSVI